MPRIDLVFIFLASLCLVTGVTLGIAMGIAHDFTYGPVHAHLNLLGWTSLALFGLVYRAYPDLAGTRLALAHLVMSATGALLFPVGIYVSIAQGWPGLAIGAALVWLLGCLLFVATVARAFRSHRAARSLGKDGDRSLA